MIKYSHRNTQGKAAGMKTALCIIGLLVAAGGFSSGDLATGIVGLLLMVPALFKSKASGKPAKKAHKKDSGLLSELTYNDPWGFSEFPYEYNGKRFRTEDERNRYRDLIRDAACHSDPLFR